MKFFYCFNIFLGKKKISHQKKIHIKKKKFSSKKKFVLLFYKFFFSCLNFLIQVKIEALFLFGNFFRSEKNFSPKKIHIKKEILIKKAYFFPFLQIFFFLSKIFLIQVKIEARFLNFLSKVLCFPLLEYFFLKKIL